jgi:hypothetical protein
LQHYSFSCSSSKSPISHRQDGFGQRFLRFSPPRYQNKNKTRLRLFAGNFPDFGKTEPMCIAFA